MRLRVLGLMAVLSSAASPALAADGNCLWTSLAPQTRDALLAAYRANPDAVFSQARPTDADQQAMARGCGMTPANMLETLATLKMTAMEHGAAAALKAERGLDPARLEAAWDGLAASDRATILAQAAAAIEGDEDTGAADAAIIRFMGALGLPLATSGPNQGLYWLRARAMRLSYERRAG